MKKIVVINSDPDFQNLIKSYLDRKGYSTMNININEPIVPRLREYLPDVVILDVEVEKDVKLCEELRRDEKIKKVKLLVLTDQSIKESLDQCKPDVVLQKPFMPNDLLEKIAGMG